MEWLAGLWTKDRHISQFGQLWNPRLKCQKIYCMVRAYFLVHGQPSYVYVFTWWKEGVLSLESLIRALISSTRAPPSRLYHLPKVHFLSPSSWIRFQHKILGDTLKSVARVKKKWDIFKIQLCYLSHYLKAYN